MSQLVWIVPSALVILLAILKVSRQAGRIEQGVAGLYDRDYEQDQRIDRIEDHLFRQPPRRSAR